MPARNLIINADDCNLTEGVTRAILECHDAGLVTSTTFMINLPTELATIKALKKRKKLGVGLHLNVTVGAPVHKVACEAITDFTGFFNKDIYTQEEPLTTAQSRAVAREYRAQVEKFKQTFKARPTHLDTHHQVHDREDFLKILYAVAKEQKLPVRRSNLFGLRKNSYRGVKTTHELLGDLRVSGYWRRKELERGLAKLKPGLSEVMAHPGYVDDSLRGVSSLRTGRFHERRLFTSEYLRKSIESKGIRLVNYTICYT